MKRMILVVVLVFCAAMASAAEKPAVLLAFEETKFKNELIAEMKANLEAAGFAVTTLNHSKGALDAVDPASYAVIFITNSGVGKKVRPWITSWIAAKGNRTKVLLHTTQLYDWKVDTTVDAVTSASTRKKTAEFAAAYTERIKALANQAK
ncbi:MAG: hypothetical protein JXB25_07410 [Deltaproteobacteria bacterium]|nr:hypothetical protein [Deltaproteobacteria bacterium]